MNKYGIDFEPFPARPDWFATPDNAYPDPWLQALGSGSSPDPAGRMAHYEKSRAHDDRILQTIDNVHQHYSLGSDRLLLGLYQPEAILEPMAGPSNSFRQVLPRRIFLIPDTHPATLAREFALGSHAACYCGSDITQRVCEALEDCYSLAPFTPVFLCSASMHARFCQHTNREDIEHFWDVLLSHRLPGCPCPEDGHTGKYTDTICKEQKFRLWWD
jgi:hypothetical protein